MTVLPIGLDVAQRNLTQYAKCSLKMFEEKKNRRKCCQSSFQSNVYRYAKTLKFYEET